MKNFVSIFKRPAILIGLLASLFLACLIIILSLFMGQEAGNFVIQVESGNVRKSITLTTSLENPDYTSRLEASSVTNMTNTTYSRFQNRIDNYRNTDGVFIDEDMHVYSLTFYLVNDCEETLDVIASMYYSNVTNNLETAVRILTISSQNDTMNCYQAKDEVETDYGAEYPSVSHFPGSGVAFNENILAFGPRKTIKYTILFWLEGMDPDCVDAIRLGTIRFSLKLSIQ